MREIQIVKRCDECGAGATESFTAGVIDRESAPALYTVDMCDTHAGIMHAVIDTLRNCAPFRKDGAPAVPASKRTTFDCPACGKSVTMPGTLRDHIYHVHLKMDTPLTPLECPACGRVFKNGQGAAAHRISTHGHDMMGDAFDALRSAGMMP